MLKILIVDDELITRKLLSKILARADERYSIVEADSGKAALEIIEKDAPDIILLDVLMPAMDGFEVCRRIKAGIKHASVPVLFLTAMEKTDDMIKGFRLGAADYITKPINAEEIKARVATHLKIRQQQVQIAQTAKLAALGQLGAGMAHEMNQPLMAISTHMELMLINEVISSHPELKERLLKIKDQFIRLGTIVKRLSDYSSGRTGTYTETDINRPVNDGYYLFAQQLKDHNINVSLDLQKEIPHIYTDRYQIQDVVINFLVNARDAVDEVYGQQEGGLIQIISRTIDDEEAAIVGVIDNGKEIEEGTETELFNPFFTTKSPGKGTGLGLSVCYTIIKDHRGLIGFSSLEKGMKVFYFALPLDKDKDMTDNSVSINKKALEVFNNAVSKGE